MASFDQGPYKYQKRVGFIDLVQKNIKKRWFYRPGPKAYQTSVGFIDLVQKSIKNVLVL